MANLFRCGGGTSGDYDKSVINVTTTESALDGVTVYCVGGGETQTSAFESGNCYFEVAYTGEYRVYVNYQGDEFDNFVTVTDIPASYSVDISMMPDGETVTPINDATILLKCAKIQSKYQYTTIAQIVGDSNCLSEMLSSENARKYLLRSTEFASDCMGSENFCIYLNAQGAEANIFLNDILWWLALTNTNNWNKLLTRVNPAMTSNTSSGTISVSGGTASYAYRNTTEWSGGEPRNGTPAVGSWIEYDFGSSKYGCVAYFSQIYENDGGVNTPIRFELQGFNGTSWVALGGNTTTGGQFGGELTIKANRYGEYKKFRLYITSKSSALYWRMKGLRFYCRDI